MTHYIASIAFAVTSVTATYANVTFVFTPNMDKIILEPTVGKALLKARSMFTENYWYWIYIATFIVGQSSHRYYYTVVIGEDDVISAYSYSCTRKGIIEGLALERQLSGQSDIGRQLSKIHVSGQVIGLGSAALKCQEINFMTPRRQNST
ncbi:hypothetical protein Fmac_006292 [Flemingia macrophylla]|uniref:Plant PDR ABC transporter associated domain-containing protein n=1 Tax=Flemingia macrophylla TaxID=520843 RepID=A0ABD1NA59_9FABA